MQCIAIPIETNYCYLLNQIGSTNVLVIDPSSVDEVVEVLRKHKFVPIGVISCHHHRDHTCGALDICDLYDVPFYLPEKDIPSSELSSSSRLLAVQDASTLDLDDITVTILETPGHTTGAACLYAVHHDQSFLFTSDTLFHCGMGRLFETSTQPQIMYNSLRKIKELPKGTLLHFGHDYATKNLNFLKTINESLAMSRLNTLPSSMKERCCYPLGEEIRLNPFLKVDDPEFRDLIPGCSRDTEPVEALRVLRQMRDVY
ncbi:hypothetical protein P9112_014050 [Eukaryota sp. TZLM1-RC]